MKVLKCRQVPLEAGYFCTKIQDWPLHEQNILDDIPYMHNTSENVDQCVDYHNTLESQLLVRVCKQNTNYSTGSHLIEREFPEDIIQRIQRCQVVQSKDQRGYHRRNGRALCEVPDCIH